MNARIASVRYNTDLLFYEAATGTGEFYAIFYMTDGSFEMTQLRTHTDWRTSWTHIIPGRFAGKWEVVDGRSIWIGFTGLLFYDSAGTGEFYTTDGQGGISLLRTYTDWPSWTQIIPGEFGYTGLTDLLFYDAAAGTGTFHIFFGPGTIGGYRRYTGWRRTWTRIVPGRFKEQPIPDFPEVEP